MKTHTISLVAVDAIIEDLSDRRGLGQEWDQIDSAIKREIRARWAMLIEKSIEGGVV